MRGKCLLFFLTFTVLGLACAEVYDPWKDPPADMNRPDAAIDGGVRD